MSEYVVIFLAQMIISAIAIDFSVAGLFLLARLSVIFFSSFLLSVFLLNIFLSSPVFAIARFILSRVFIFFSFPSLLYCLVYLFILCIDITFFKRFERDTIIILYIYF